MKLKRLFVVLLCVAVLLSAVSMADTDTDSTGEPAPMSIQISYDKESVKVGEPITVSWSYDNVAEPVDYYYVDFSVTYTDGSSKTLWRSNDLTQTSYTFTYPACKYVYVFVSLRGDDGRSLSEGVNIYPYVAPTATPTLRPTATPRPTNEPGTTGGSTTTGGMSSTTTGGSTDDNTGGMSSTTTGGSTGDNTGGSTGDNTGGSSSDSTGGSSGDDNSGNCSNHVESNSYLDESFIVDGYKRVDNQQHIAIIQFQKKWICRSCNRQVGSGIAGSQEVLEPHDFNSTTHKCRQCLAVDLSWNCQHESTETQTDVVQDKIVSFDSQGHTWSYAEQENAVCTTCGEVVSTRLLGEKYTEFEEHNYKEGVCEDCGYGKTSAKPTATPTRKPPIVRPTYAPDDDVIPTASPTIQPTETVTPTPSATPEVQPTAAPTRRPTPAKTAKPVIISRAEKEMTGRVCGNVVNVRANAGTGHEVIALKMRDESVAISAVITLSDGNRWYEIDVNGVKGYIFGDLVETGSGNVTEAEAVVQNADWSEEQLADMEQLKKKFAEACENLDVEPTSIISETEQRVVECLPFDEQKLIMIAAIGHRDAVLVAIDEYGLEVSEVGRFMINLVGERIDKVQAAEMGRSIAAMFTE